MHILLVQASPLGEKRRSIIGHTKPYCLHMVHITSNLHKSDKFRAILLRIPANCRSVSCIMSVLCPRNIRALSTTSIKESGASMLTLDGLPDGRQKDQVDSLSKNLTLLWVLWSGCFCPHVYSTRKARGIMHLRLWHYNMSFILTD